MINLISLPDLPEFQRTNRFLLSLPENIVLFRQKTIFGYRLMAGFVDMQYFDTSYSELNICCGDNEIAYNDMFCKILFIISKNPPDKPFQGIPKMSKIKPYFNDTEFCETINTLLTAQRNVVERSVANQAK